MVNTPPLFYCGLSKYAIPYPNHPYTTCERAGNIVQSWVINSFSSSCINKVAQQKKRQTKSRDKRGRGNLHSEIIRYVFKVRICIYIIDAGVHNSGSTFFRTTKHCAEAKVIAYFLRFFSSRTNMCNTSHAPSRKTPLNGRSSQVTPEIRGPQFGTCFISPSWGLEFGGRSQIFGEIYGPLC